MKFRDIAKMHAYNCGMKTPMGERDMRHYLDHLGDPDAVTAGRLAKANEALDTLRESFASKWGLSKKFRNAPHPFADADTGAE